MSCYQSTVGENQTPQNASGPIQCIFTGYLPGTRHSAEISELWFLPSKKGANLGSGISQTCLGLNPDSSNQCLCDLGQVTLAP